MNRFIASIQIRISKATEGFLIVRSNFASDLPKIIRFSIVGLLNTALDFGAFSLLYFVVHLNFIVANTIAYGLATANSYILNRLWTFRTQSHSNPEVTMALQFVILNLVGLGLVNLTLWALSSFLPILASKGIAILVSFTWNYLTGRNLVFSRR